MKTLSIVIPAFNEEECVAALVEELKKNLDPLPYSYEVIIIDDGSKDKTFEVLRELSEKYPFLKGIKLSRNMGHQAALDCGLHHASGDAVISMDADLQHPPELIPELVKKWEEGYDVVTTQKLENQDSGIAYKLYAKFFYSFFNKFSQIKLTPNASDFRLLSRKSLDAVLRMPEYHKFYRGLVPYIGFKTANISFDVHKRHAGTRKYNFKQSFKLASDGLFSFSDFALKIPFYIGVVLMLFILIYLIYAAVSIIFFGNTWEQGWTSIIVILIISISLQLLFMGIMGIYIGKIFFEVKNRPVFFTDEIVGEIKPKKENTLKK